MDTETRKGVYLAHGGLSLLKPGSKARTDRVLVPVLDQVQEGRFGVGLELWVET